MLFRGFVNDLPRDLVDEDMLRDFQKLCPFKWSIFCRLYFIFGQKFRISSQVNEQISRGGDPVEDCGQNCCS